MTPSAAWEPTTSAPKPGKLIRLPVNAAAADIALDELELVFAFLYARVGNRADAEDLTQQVALKAIPRLRAEAEVQAIRAYLFATARSVLASFWSTRFGLPVEELREELWQEPQRSDPSDSASERVEQILAQLPANYRHLLELRFLRGYSLKEVASEMGSSVGAIKVMQLRALRAAAKVTDDG